MIDIDGWISLHRKLLDNPIVCKDPDHIAVWIYLLLNATHSGYDTIFEGSRITLKPGQLITGRKSISSSLKISESKVQRILKTFEIEHQIEQQTTPRNRLISILNWSQYQQTEQVFEQQLNNKRTTTEQQVNTNNNDNKVNNGNKANKNNKGLDSVVNSLTENTSYREALKGFIEMRKTLKKPLTEKALSMVINKLDKLAKSDVEKIEILNQSIMNSWQGVFELKQPVVSKPSYATNKKEPKKDFKEREYDYDELERKLLGWDKKTDKVDGG